jgi:hypothetical protein
MRSVGVGLEGDALEAAVGALGRLTASRREQESVKVAVCLISLPSSRTKSVGLKLVS